jgi:hypothetical protein
MECRENFVEYELVGGKEAVSAAIYSNKMRKGILVAQGVRTRLTIAEGAGRKARHYR